ncbi:heterokaryon incompatibility protein-domain-containing protein [Diaporthe sp. PMI_573]|nr:heterokaryon incompatibility protein-domain-containing protein [Diaporthaceae sp. PMI_573]
MASSQDSQSDFSIYPPLDKATRSFRLLRFAEPPLNSPDKLHITLTVHELPTADESAREGHQRIKFIALSYVWGNPMPEYSIIVNGKCLQIRENLHALLQVLHIKTQGEHSLGEYLRECPYLWADAICIDQTFGEETNHQVNMMGDIYLRADHVVAWLGPAADRSALAMNRLRQAIPSDSWEDKGLWEESLEPEAVDALVALLNRPYWQRLWIAQEFTLAKRLLLFCGKSMFTLHGGRGEDRIKAIMEWSPAYPTRR